MTHILIYLYKELYDFKLAIYKTENHGKIINSVEFVQPIAPKSFLDL